MPLLFLLLIGAGLVFVAARRPAPAQLSGTVPLLPPSNVQPLPQPQIDPLGGFQPGPSITPSPLTVNRIGIPETTIAEGTTDFVEVLDTSGMETPDSIAASLASQGWTPSIAPTITGPAPASNPFGVTGTLWLAPSVRTGPTLTINSLPIPLSATLFIVDGGPTPPAPLSTAQGPLQPAAFFQQQTTSPAPWSSGFTPSFVPGFEPGAQPDSNAVYDLWLGVDMDASHWQHVAKGSLAALGARFADGSMQAGTSGQILTDSTGNVVAASFAPGTLELFFSGFAHSDPTSPTVSGTVGAAFHPTSEPMLEFLPHMSTAMFSSGRIVRHGETVTFHLEAPPTYKGDDVSIVLFDHGWRASSVVPGQGPGLWVAAVTRTSSATNIAAPLPIGLMVVEAIS